MRQTKAMLLAVNNQQECDIKTRDAEIQRLREQNARSQQFAGECQDKYHSEAKDTRRLKAITGELALQVRKLEEGDDDLSDEDF